MDAFLSILQLGLDFNLFLNQPLARKKPQCAKQKICETTKGLLSAKWK